MESTGDGALRVRVATVVGTAALLPSLFNQLLYPVTFTYFSTQDPRSYLFGFLYSLLVVAMAALLALSRRKGDALLLNDRRLVALFGALGSLGIVGVSRLDFSTMPSRVLLGVAVTLVAVYVTTHFLFWSLQLAQAERRGFLVDIALAFALFSLVTGLRLTLGVRSLAITVACPLVSAAAALYLSTVGPQRGKCTGTLHLAALPWRFIAPCLVFVALCTAGILLFRQEATDGMQQPGRSLANFGIAALSMGLALLYRESAKMRRGASLRAFVFTSFSFVGCALLSLLVSGDALPMGSLPLIAANAVLVEFVWMLVVRDANRMHASPTPVCALLLVVAIILPRVVRMGTVYWQLVLSDPVVVLDPLVVVIASAFVSSAVVTLSLMRFFTATELATASGDETQPTDDAVFEQLRQAFGLTDREVEVARVAVSCPTAEDMAEKLFIAESTVRTHLKRIYRKTGVHGKQELAALVEEYRTAM